MRLPDVGIIINGKASTDETAAMEFQYGDGVCGGPGICGP